MRVAESQGNVTPFEPGWEGFATLEISSTTPLPAKVYANEGLCQILFLRPNEPGGVGYADRTGKYQKQQGIVPPKF
jgi:dCTP deaminase